MNTLKDLTQEIHYENFRAQLVRRGSQNFITNQSGPAVESREFIRRHMSIEEVRRLLAEKNKQVHNVGRKTKTKLSVQMFLFHIKFSYKN